MITLTEQAAVKIKKQLTNRGKGLGIRVGVKTTGCSGLAYTVEYVDKSTEDDVSFISNEVNIYVDKKSLIYLEGIKMDWIKQGLNEGFDFINPQEIDRCGCGESFRI